MSTGAAAPPPSRCSACSGRPATVSANLWECFRVPHSPSLRFVPHSPPEWATLADVSAGAAAETVENKLNDTMGERAQRWLSVALPGAGHVAGAVPGHVLEVAEEVPVPTQEQGSS